MSTKAKGVFTEKVFKLIEKMDIDDKIHLFHLFKDQLSKELLDETKRLDEQKEYRLQQNDEINKAK